MAFDLLWRAITRQYYKQYVISLTQDLANRIFEVFKSVIIVKNPIIQDIMKIKENPWPSITFTNGSEIHFRSIAGDAIYIRGRAADRIVLDEAAFIPGHVENAIRPLLLDRGGDMVRISTPKGMNMFYQEYMRGLKNKQNPGSEPGYISFHFASWDNPHIDQKWLETERLRIGEQSLEWQTEYAAEFLDDALAVFRSEWIEKAQDTSVQWLEHGIDGKRYVMGVDIAQTIDFTVVCVLEINGINVHLVAFDRFNQLGFRDMCNRIEAYRSKFLPEWTVLDQTGQIGDPLGEMLNKDYGYIESVKLSLQTKQDIIMMLSVALERERLKYNPNRNFDRDPNRNPMVIADELRWYQSERTEVLKTMRYSAPEGFHDDVCVGLALAVYAANRVLPREAYIHMDSDSFAERLSKKYRVKDPFIETTKAPTEADIEDEAYKNDPNTIIF